MQILVIAIGALIAGFVLGKMAAEVEAAMTKNSVVDAPELSREELSRYLEAEKS